MSVEEGFVSKRQARKSADLKRIRMKEEQTVKLKRVRAILKKAGCDRTEDETKVLNQFQDVVEVVEQQMIKHKSLKDRLKEIEDPPDVLRAKCVELAETIRHADFLVTYTGAGISTAAKIPDYRGPEGVWTLLQKGQDVKVLDIATAEPTYTHMSVSELYRRGFIAHVVSQNCDGLHLRSGLPRGALSEVHGNMYIEVCTKCKPLRQYVRLFDVTERTSLRRHKTGRYCHKCSAELIDTIVHFGERGRLRWPINWEGAVKAVENCDVILCLGTSLKVLRKYHCLWALDKPLQERPKVYIVNLQWTPKDDKAVLKINGKCDEVMKLVMDHLGIPVPNYSREKDQIFRLAVQLTSEEEESTTRQQLTFTQQQQQPELNNYKMKSTPGPSFDTGPFYESTAKVTKEDPDDGSTSVDELPQQSIKEMLLSGVKDEVEEQHSTSELHREPVPVKTEVSLSKSSHCLEEDLAYSTEDYSETYPNDEKNGCHRFTEEISEEKEIMPGWFGKGFAKLKKAKKKRP
ncbi:NAD-dependent protein deacetylase sirtuin-7-like [Limulus polyphemus]|uniref:Regulatory protein SIR2 homolog 7 n=1 Tax=Limulus polyphemus TaxID=6850 RepID=A0ABM1BHC4_LIMPO|nr:NAD-dependent protein deacetylase sirtuin-7-like [Limulus polyphemus]